MAAHRADQQQRARAVSAPSSRGTGVPDTSTITSTPQVGISTTATSSTTGADRPSMPSSAAIGCRRHDQRHPRQFGRPRRHRRRRIVGRKDEQQHDVQQHQHDDPEPVHAIPPDQPMLAANTSWFGKHPTASTRARRRGRRGAPGRKPSLTSASRSASATIATSRATRHPARGARRPRPRHRRRRVAALHVSPRPSSSPLSKHQVRDHTLVVDDTAVNSSKRSSP